MCVVVAFVFCFAFLPVFCLFCFSRHRFWWGCTPLCRKSFETFFFTLLVMLIVQPPPTLPPVLPRPYHTYSTEPPPSGKRGLSPGRKPQRLNKGSQRRFNADRPSTCSVLSVSHRSLPSCVLRTKSSSTAFINNTHTHARTRARTHTQTHARTVIHTYAHARAHTQTRTHARTHPPPPPVVPAVK